MRILHIEDDADLRRFIKKGLEREGFAVDGAGDAKTGVQLAAENVYDIMLVDIVMPTLDGNWALRTLRQDGQTAAIFMISGQGSEEDKLRAFEGGADDYMVKPILLSELVARIRTWLRRRNEFMSSEAPATSLTVGTLKLDLLKHRASIGDRMIPLTSKEFMVLEYLMRHAERIVTQTALAQAVWSMDVETGSNVVEFHINRLRKKIDEEGKLSLIQTVRGSGYMMEAPP